MSRGRPPGNGTGAGGDRGDRSDAGGEPPNGLRRRLRLLGLGSIALGVVLAVVHRLLPVELGTENRPIVVMVAVVALLAGAWYALDAHDLERDWWRPPDPEPGYHVLAPGEEFEALSEYEVKSRLRRRAIVSLIDATGCARSVAETHVERGTWTDDPVAAAYLGPGLRPSLFRALLDWLRGESLEERARERTIAAIRAVRDGEVDVPDEVADEPVVDAGQDVAAGVDADADAVGGGDAGADADTDVETDTSVNANPEVAREP